MITNTDATLYHRIRGKSSEGDSWQKVYLPAVWWYENISSSITKNGMKVANGATNVLTVRIPDVSVEIQKEDYTVKSLSGIPHCCVNGVNYNTFGSNPHIKVVGIRC